MSSISSENLRHRSAVTKARPYEDIEETRAMLSKERQDSSDQVDVGKLSHTKKSTAKLSAWPFTPSAPRTNSPNQEVHESILPKYTEIHRLLETIQDLDRGSIFAMVEVAYLGGLIGYHQEAIDSKKWLPKNQYRLLLDTLGNKAFAEYYQDQLDKFEISLQLIQAISKDNQYEKFFDELIKCFGDLDELIMKSESGQSELNRQNYAFLGENNVRFLKFIYAYALPSYLSLYGVKDKSIVPRINVFFIEAREVTDRFKNNRDAQLIKSYQAQIEHCLETSNAHAVRTRFDPRPLFLSCQVKEVILREDKKNNSIFGEILKLHTARKIST